MEILDKIKVLERICKESKKYGMFISFSRTDEWQEIIAAAPYLEGCDQILVDCEGWLLFDNEEEMDDHYDRTVGPDGLPELNTYNGTSGVYAVTCNKHGQIENENT